MDNLVLNLQSKNQIEAYMADHCFVPYERAIFTKNINSNCRENDQIQLDWFRFFWRLV